MVHGKFSDARSSAPRNATLTRTEGGGWLLHLETEERSFEPPQVAISDRIGSIPRRLRFPDGSEFETHDNDGVDALLGPRQGGAARLVQELERRWAVAVVALFGVILAAVLFLKIGLPAAAGWVADRLPPESDRMIGRQALDVLDQGVLKPSTLDVGRQAYLQNVFIRMTAPLDDGHEYRLVLRGSPRLGPNAIALPAGIIIMTDELVALSQHDEELMAVLAHEIGHVRGRHALRQIIQGTGVSMIAVAVLGDVSNVSALASAAPVLLQAKHSRDFEREADSFARLWLTKAGIATNRFDDILCRMTDSGRDATPTVPVFLSTHPDTNERVRCAASKS